MVPSQFGQSAESLPGRTTSHLHWNQQLNAAGYDAALLLTTEKAPVDDQVARALARESYDVIVVGAGLRTLSAMADKFERIMNTLHEKAPGARLAFNSQPDDSRCGGFDAGFPAQGAAQESTVRRHPPNQVV